jgi:hypothetical protein
MSTAPEPLLIGRAGAAGMIGQSISKVDELVADGRIDAVKSGKRLLIVVASLKTYAASLPKATLRPYIRKARDNPSTEAA